MSSDHYFTPNPESKITLRDLSVRLSGHRYTLSTASGIFSPDHIDTGTQVLLANTPAPPSVGNLLDLGCGWGPIALSLAIDSPQATVWAVDTNERALELVRTNARRIGLDNVNAVTPDSVPASVRFATVRSNPPIRVGKKPLHDLLERWLLRLDADADAWLVVQRNLGADSLQQWLRGAFPDDLDVSWAARSKGYRVMQVRRLAAAQSSVSSPS